MDDLPNEETKAVLEATRRGENLEEFNTLDEMLASLHSGLKDEEDNDE